MRDVVTDPEYLDVTVPPAATFTHPTPRGHTVFAYVIGGKGVFCQQKDPYSYEAEGANYFDMERGALIGDGHLVLFGDGDAVTVTTEDEPVRFLLISGKPIGEPDRLVRADRDEHPGGAAGRLRRAAAGHVHQGRAPAWLGYEPRQNSWLGLGISPPSCSGPRLRAEGTPAPSLQEMKHSPPLSCQERGARAGWGRLLAANRFSS